MNYKTRRLAEFEDRAYLTDGNDLIWLKPPISVPKDHLLRGSDNCPEWYPESSYELDPEKVKQFISDTIDEVAREMAGAVPEPKFNEGWCDSHNKDGCDLCGGIYCSHQALTATAKELGVEIVHST